ncbi:MAG: hypothetical protein JWR51_4707 [Devosia sp.]|uniref:hypothetical protein n=1 Tax=Devosia sp. TaxID=1871048 RepID=UPI002612A63C|nr:hypothetical protein [Devosia sp.]MDB5531604.1 hypothetical protein [Devosia sp.]
MPLPNLSVCREFSAERINAIIAHPEVRPWVGMPQQGYIDLTPMVADLRNVLLMGQGGGFFFHQLLPGIYEVHTQFLPEHRGANVLQAAADAERFMFTRTDCLEIRSKVPEHNKGAIGFARAMHYELQYERATAWPTDNGPVAVKYFARTLNQWANRCEGVEATGHWFHEKLEAAKHAAGATSPIHDDDLIHDRFVGATAEMIMAGQLAKAMGFYRQWAVFAGYGPISIIAEYPVVLDIGDALLAIKDQDFEVLLCR